MKLSDTRGNGVVDIWSRDNLILTNETEFGFQPNHAFIQAATTISQNGENPGNVKAKKIKKMKKIMQSY